MNDLTLYVDSKFTSPFAMSVFVALKEKSLPFEISTVDLYAGEQHKADYAKLSVTQRVPTLVHGDFKLSESSAITEYLEEVFPAPSYPQVYPGNIRERAKARQVQAWLRSDFLPIREERSTETIFIKRADKPLSKEAQVSAAKLFAGLDRLIKDGALNLFNEWCVADTDLALMLNRLLANGHEVPPRLAAYARHQWQRKSVQEWIGQKRPNK
ncbi:MAG TPA: glutathione transferase [Gammaproteobacteria bacterium]|nr:glutathione transferase [Gammaproteobacteria bacterium]